MRLEGMSKEGRLTQSWFLPNQLKRFVLGLQVMFGKYMLVGEIQSTAPRMPMVPPHSVGKDENSFVLRTHS